MAKWGMAHGGVGELAQDIARVMSVSSVDDLRRLTGGASRETWMFSADGEKYVMQRVRPGHPGGLGFEPQVLMQAHLAGVPVPQMVFDGSSSDALERPFMIVRAVDGETIARKILRDDEFAEARTVLASQLGAALARTHVVKAEDVSGLPGPDQLTMYRNVMDELGEPHPVFEIAFRWLEQNRPSEERRTLVHGDFRLGNMMVDSSGLTAVLDWELAHIGDPMEDLGWLCVRAWRFGGAHPVAGVGTYGELFSAYEEVSGIRPDINAVRWWEVMGTLKWGIICIHQATSHLRGLVRSHELAAIGRRVCENEYDLIEYLTELVK
jgi:aminoglycoside phosphotransferase (APT) family kinase protein